MEETHFDPEAADISESIGGREVLVGGMYIKIEEGPWDHLSIRVAKEDLPKLKRNPNKVPSTRAIAIIPKQKEDEEIWNNWLDNQGVDSEYIYPFIYRNRLHSREGDIFPIAFNSDPLFGVVEGDLTLKISTSKGVIEARIHHYPDAALAKISDDEDILASELL